MGRRLIAALLWPPLMALTPLPLPAPPTQDRVGNRSLPFEPLRPLPAPEGDRRPRSCTADRHWCAELRRVGEGGAWELDILEQGVAPRRVVLAGQEAEELSFGLLPRLFVEAGGAALIGVERTRSTAFSGGGASATDLVLVRAEAGGGPVAEVLAVHYIGSAMIRACFSERDMRARRDACHDEYELAGNFQLDLDNGEGRARFLLTAIARTYPGRRSRTDDSATAPPLRRSELVWAADPACTYTRILTYDETSDRYVPDQPLPDCPDYFDF